RWVALLAPHEQAALGAPSRQRIERGVMAAAIEELGMRLLLGATHGHRFASHDLRDARRWIVHVADENRLRGTDNDARGLESHIEAVRAEVALLGGVIFRVDEDRVVGTGCDARLA